MKQLIAPEFILNNNLYFIYIIYIIFQIDNK